MYIRRVVPNINSAKMEESRKFYADFLGMKPAMDMEWVITFVADNNPTAQITLVKSDETVHSPQGITISIEVEDVDKLYQDAKTSGYEITYALKDEPWGVRRFWVLDPNGVTINIMMHV